MTDKSNDKRNEEPYELQRFMNAQLGDYEVAISEIRAGRKRSHWIWYIFPQLDGLAYSTTSKHYSIKSLNEARAYLSHPVLGARLIECAEAVLGVKGRTVEEIFGFPDHLKVRSSATLFELVSPSGSVFTCLLDECYAGQRDDKTLNLLNAAGSS